MSFGHAETEYEKLHKRSDYRLRQAPQEEEREQGHRKYPMEGYEASEEELRQRAEPTQQILLKGGGRRLSAGYNREHKLTMSFSKDMGKGRSRDEEVFRAEEARDDPILPAYLRRGTSGPTENAQILESSKEKQISYLFNQLKKAADASEQTFLSGEFPFLSTIKEKAQIQMLEEEARAYPMERARTELDRQQAAALRRDVSHKEEEQRNLLGTLTVQVKPEKKKNPKSLWAPVRLSHTTAPQTEETDGKPSEEDGPPDKGSAENPLV